MVVDRYTKIVLTVIAGCLLWLCVMNTGLGVQAQQPPVPAAVGPAREVAPQPVVIVGWTVNGEVPVRVESMPRDAVLVKIQPQPPQRFPGPAQ